jgi:hypothetical protein
MRHLGFIHRCWWWGSSILRLESWCILFWMRTDVLFIKELVSKRFEGLVGLLLLLLLLLLGLWLIRPAAE